MKQVYRIRDGRSYSDREESSGETVTDGETEIRLVIRHERRCGRTVIIYRVLWSKCFPECEGEEREADIADFMDWVRAKSDYNPTCPQCGAMGFVNACHSVCGNCGYVRDCSE